MSQETLLRLSLEQIIPNPQQPRKRFNEAMLRQLAQSIRTQGVIQPLIVRKSKVAGHYELIAGERRWRAMRYTEIKEVDVVVKEIEDPDVLEMALLENIQRENLTPIEEAACYRDLLEQHHYTQEELAKRMGKDRSTIANLIRLLQLPAAIQNDLEEARLTIGHTRPLLALGNPQDQLYFREQILKHRWSVRQTEKSVKRLVEAFAPQKKASTPQKSSGQADRELQIQLMNLETELEHRFGTKVSIQHQANGTGSVQIKYVSLEDFDRIYSLLKPA